MTLEFDFHGIRAEVSVDDAVCAEQIGRDFSSFRIDTAAAAANPAAPDIRMLVSLGDPPMHRIPAGARPWIHTKVAKVFSSAGLRYLDSDGELLVIQDFRNDRTELHSLDRNLLWERSYLVLMSRIAEHLDRRGLHRIHAMGVARNGRAVLCLLPMGGGKSTLTLGMLAKDGFTLLSDEAPIVALDGRLYPFPVRLGITPDTSHEIPARFLRRFPRKRRGPKMLIDADYFKDRTATVVRPGLLFVGRRTDSGKPAIEPLSQASGARALWENCVRAKGLPQMLEHMLRPHPWAAARTALEHFSRIRACYRLLRRSEGYMLHLCDDLAANADAVAGFAAERLG
jgi:hypothetical protein